MAYNGVYRWQEEYSLSNGVLFQLVHTNNKFMLCSSQKFQVFRLPTCVLLPALHGREVLVRMAVGAGQSLCIH